MGLVSVNTNNNWLSSATNTSFNHGADAERYKTFTNELVSGGKPIFDTDLLTTMMSKMNNFFSGFSAGNKSSLIDMMLGAIENVLGIGYNILSKLGITSIVSTICGSFDNGTYGRYGNMNGLYSLGLMSLLTALLCMAIKGALGIVAGALGAVGLAVGSIVGVVDTALDTLGFNPIKPLTNGIGSFIFDSPQREYSNTGIDIPDMINDITGNNDLLDAFKNTSTAERLLSGYTGKGYEFESKVEALLPNYSISSLGGSRNAGAMLLDYNKSKAVDGISNVISSVSKKDYLMLL